MWRRRKKASWRRRFEEFQIVEVKDSLGVTRAREIRAEIEASSLPICLAINSGGGVVEVIPVIADAVRAHPVEVVGVVVRESASAAFQVLQLCSRRYALEDARLMFHFPWVDLEDFIETRFWEERFALVCQAEGRVIFPRDERFLSFLEELSRRSGQPMDNLQRWAREEREFSASAAIRLGFIDGIL